MNTGRWQQQAVGLVVAVLLLGGGVAEATQKFGPLELSGNLQSQNIVRNPDIDEFHFIQQRNTMRFRVDWDWFQDGKLIERFELPFIRSSKLFLLYRGVYDSVYDTAPTLRERDLRGRKPSRIVDRDIGDLNRSTRDSLKFENQLRELYVDLKFKDIPLSLRMGKQQIIWGEADNFRMLDRANSLDTSWHYVMEIPPPSFGWDDLRIPSWMIKGLWDFGSLWNMSNVFAEAFWNPGDWRPVKVGWLPRPWGVRLQHPLTNLEDGAYNNQQFLSRGANRLINSGFFRQGDYSRNPMDNSQVGVRFSGMFPNGFQFGLHYFYKRWSGDDGTPFAPVRGIQNSIEGQIRTNELLNRGTVPIEYITPYIHTVGLSANWFEGNWTQTIFRMETVYDFGIPMFSRIKETTYSPFLPGTTRRDYWKGMIAFDRPTWIRWLNKKTTFFITGQWFIHHIMHNSDHLTTGLDLPTAGRRGRGFGCDFVGDARKGIPCDGRQSAQNKNGNAAFRDDVRSWEMLFTLVAFTFYKGGSVVPLGGIIYDPINSHSVYPFINLQWVVTPNFIVDISERIFAVGQPDVQKGVFDPWLLGTNRGRSETSLRLTYQF